jgi:hypothetical protein
LDDVIGFARKLSPVETSTLFFACHGNSDWTT